MIPTAIAASVFLLLQTGKGSIEGSVVNSVTNKPISGAQITIVGFSSGPPVGTATPQPLDRSTVVVGPTGTMVAGVTGGVLGGTRAGQIPPVITDPNGHFVLRDLNPGRYTLRAAAEGFSQQDYGSSRGNPLGMPIQVDVAADQAASAVFRMIPDGTVSGRVTGPNGEPLVNVEIAVLRSAYDPNGRKTFQQAGTAQTNDRGEYRLFWINPGRYYLSAAPSNRPVPGIPFNPGLRTNKYARLFYPSSSDIARATLIDIQPAAELSGLDFRMVEQQTYRVRGRVIDPSSGQAPRGAGVSIMPRDAVLNVGAVFTGNSYNPADGSFELRDVPSGSYVIRAQLALNVREPGQQPPTPPTAVAMLEVSGADVDGVVLTPMPPISISGRIRIEGGAVPPSINATVTLRPASTGPVIGSMRPAQTNPDGTFILQGIPPGEYEVNVGAGSGSSQMTNMYVKEIRFGALDLRATPLVVTGSAVSDALEIVYSPNGGQLNGTLRSGSQSLSQNVRVVLIPDQRNRRDLYKTSGNGPNGTFAFRSIPPGSYKAFAWQNVEQYSWFDPEVLARYEQYGVPVTLAESSNVTLELSVIPPQASR
jgi:hypothetical protein